MARPLAFLLALYTLATALIGHHFWTMDGAVRSANAINFYKNISIVGRFRWQVFGGCEEGDGTLMQL
jgi:uncharacterized membrane protein YphA (DoxX/SURF4 family)